MNRRLRRIVLVLALVTASMAGATGSARAATGMELAIQDDAVFVTQEYLGHAKAFPLLDDLRVRWIRVNVGWAAVVGQKTARLKKKPAIVNYDFTSYDTLINAARENGVNVEFGLTGTAPAWATGNKKVGPYKPNAKYFKEFVTAAAQHFGGFVNRWSIWNEPNHTGWLAPLKSQASLYRSLYLAGYQAIKSVEASDQVLIGETAPYASRRGVANPPLKFLRDLTRRGGLKADGYAHHPYDFTHKPTYKFPGKDNVTLSGLSKLTKLLDSLARSNKLETPDGRALDLYLTEFGYLRAGRQKISESNRARYLKQGYSIALKNPRVRQMLHFLLAQPAKKYRFFDTSLVSQRGGKTAAFKALSSWAASNASRVNTR